MPKPGYVPTPEHIENNRKSHYGHTHTPETRAKMSATRTGRARTPEERAAISRGKKRQYELCPKEKFLALGDVITKDILFEKYVVEGKSTKHIAKELNVSSTTITRYLHWYEIPVRPSNRSPEFKYKEDRSENYCHIVYNIHGFERVCEWCGATEKIHVHHKDRDRTNNSKDNIMILCISCHTYLHWRNSTYNGVQFKVPKGEPKGDMS